jgi:anti-anti-sigma regulatory factor
VTAGVLVLDLGDLEHFSSTTLMSLGKMQAKFASVRSGLVLTGVGQDARDVLGRTGLLTQIGERNVLPSDRHLGGSLDAGLRRGRELLSELGARPA